METKKKKEKKKRWKPTIHKVPLEFDEAFKVGVDFETEVANWLRAFGFYVIQSEGSKGIFDLVAIKDGITFGIQCKRNILYLTAREYDRLHEAHNNLKILSIICCKGSKNKFDFLDCSVPRSNDSDMKPFDIFKFI